ncbi:MAG: hypothetical protein JO363_19790 [Solirubrobacterales bacterium]|nr:hypothetical protein [Solirubrobacterales bacterium]
MSAVSRSILTAVWHMLQTGELDNDPGSDYFTRQSLDASPDDSSDNS